MTNHHNILLFTYTMYSYSYDSLLQLPLSKIVTYRSTSSYITNYHGNHIYSILAIGPVKYLEKSAALSYRSLTISIIIINNLFYQFQSTVHQFEIHAIKNILHKQNLKWSNIKLLVLFWINHGEDMKEIVLLI